MRPPVLVTGGTGFLGARVARDLVERGHRVHVLARPDSDRSALAGVDVQFEPGDLRDAVSLDSALGAAQRGAQAPPQVVHSGAVISYRTRDAALQREVNVEGTRRLIDACRRRGCGRVVHVSSVVAVGWCRPGEVMDEDWAFNGASLRVDYVDTKRAAEELALAAADELDLVAVCPGVVFGPSTRRSNSAHALRRIGSGRLPFAPPGVVGAVGLEDVSAAILAALERGRRGRRYLLIESNLSLLQLFRMAAEELGGVPVRRVLPHALRPLMVAAAGLVDRVRPLEVVTPQSLRLGFVGFAGDSRRAREELGWRPRPFRDVLRATCDALRAEGPR